MHDQDGILSKIGRLKRSWKRSGDAPCGDALLHVQSLCFSRRFENESKIRALTHCVPVSPTDVLCRVLGRFKLYVDPQDFGLSPHLMLDGYWESWTTEAIVECLEPGMIAADIGANVGYFTMLMADLVGPSGHVFAFEPNPAMVGRIEKSASLNGFRDRVTVCPVALADENDRQMSFITPSGEPKNAHIVPFHGQHINDSVVIDAQRLDSREEWRAIEFLKIDAEGAEEMIWAGASGLRDLDRLRTIILEFNPMRYRDGAAYLRDILDWGFSLAWINPNAGIEPITPEAIFARNSIEDIMLVLRR